MGGGDQGHGGQARGLTGCFFPLDHRCMLRADHPVIGARISVKQFREAAYVLVS
jgi:hypothetical protein